MHIVPEGVIFSPFTRMVFLNWADYPVPRLVYMLVKKFNN
jgi:hypothetical protein